MTLAATASVALWGLLSPRRRVLAYRIQKLRIPPAWRDVRIARSDSAPLQAVGVDKKGRTQYLYHLRFRQQREEAKQFFSQHGEPLKVQLIDEKTAGQSEVSCYTIKDRDTFVDFCVGPHVPSTGRLKAFKLLNTSNAYWKGDAKGTPMQRVYGTAFASSMSIPVGCWRFWHSSEIRSRASPPRRHRVSTRSRCNSRTRA